MEKDILKSILCDKQENSTTPPEEFEKIVQERSNGRAKGFTVIGELGEGDRKKYFYE